MRKIKV